MRSEIDTLATGYGLIEGPRMDARGNLYFSDVIKGGVYRRAPDGGIETIVPRRRGVGGIALHAAGGIVISGKNVCHVREGETRMLYEREDIPGFNDLFTDSRGRVYVGSLRSDPFGSGTRVPGELYRLDGPGRAVELYSDVIVTNGIGFSPDAQRLYHSDSGRNQILVHDVTPNGECKNRRVFAQTERGSPDGLAVDREGFVWVAMWTGGCVSRFAPDGSLERQIDVPARRVTSLCFGAGDGCELYIVSADNTSDPGLGASIFRTRAPAPGLEAPLARI